MAAWKGLIAAVAGLLGLVLAPLSHAQAPAAPILEAPAILGLPDTSHASVRRFLNLNTPRVLAFGPNGTFGWQAGGGDAAFVEQTALSNCERRAGAGACTIALLYHRAARSCDCEAGARMGAEPATRGGGHHRCPSHDAAG